MVTSGARVGGYRVIRELGQGGMGTVYLASHPTLPRHDALKVLSRALSLDPDFRSRFLREADVAARLDHPNIVSVYDRGQAEDGELWIAMQFVDGTDAAAAQRDGPMPPDRAVHVIAEVAKALDHAHIHGVVHRDVKPANFLLSGTPGPAERVLLGDFGLARALGDVGLTATGTMLGTVAYSAPEVLANHHFDGRSDVYSLGCALFRLLTGRTPFPGTNGIAAVMMAHLHQPPPRVTDVRPDLPRGLDTVVAVAMAKDPAARFPTAGELAKAATDALHEPQGPLRLPPQPPPPVRPRPPRRRRRGALIGALAAVALLAAGTVAVVAWPRDDDTVAAGATTQSGRSSTRAAGPPATNVPASALRSILLPSDAVGDDGAGGPLVLERDVADFPDDAATVNVAECLSAWAPAQPSVYADSGYKAVAVQVLRGLNRRVWQDSVTQAVVAFQPSIQAGRFLGNQQGAWALCGGHQIVVTPPGEAPQVWTLAQPINVAGVPTIQATVAGGGGSCQRGIATRGNVIIDVRQCVSTGNNDVAGLVNRIAERVPRQ